MEKYNQFLVDLRLLLKRYLTERAIAEAMVKVYGGNAETYILIFLRFILDPVRVDISFLEDFYTTFQNDLDEISRTGEEPPGWTELPMGNDLLELIKFQKKNAKDLQEYADVALRVYHETLLNYRKMTHRYAQLLELLERAVDWGG